MYSLAFNELLSWPSATLAPDVLELFQIWMLIVTTLVLDGLYGFDKAYFALPPLLVARLPLLFPIKRSTRDNCDSWHAWRLGQHW